MTDLERLGRNVGEQHGVEFWLTVRRLGWERWITPRWTQPPEPVYYPIGKAMLVNEQRRSEALVHLFTGI